MSNRNELKWSNAMAPETANKVPAWDASGNPVVVDPLGGSAADIAVSARGIWEYQSLTTTPVADGKIRFNSTTIASITQMLIAQTTDEGTDAGFLFATLKAGDDVYFQLRADATKWLRFTLSATPVDNGSWWTMAVTLVGSGGALPGSATKCIVRFTASNLAYNYFKGSYASLGALNSAVPTASPGDYALVDVAATPAVPYFWDATDSLWRVVGGITLAAAGSTPNANGATVNGSVLNLEPASFGAPGIVNTVAQTFAGAKTFGNGILVTGLVLSKVLIAGGTGAVMTDNDLHFDTTFKNLGIGVGSSPFAHVHIKGGTATALSAPLKINPGIGMTTPEDGAMEYHSSHLWFTIGTTRLQLDQQSGTITLGAIGSTPNANAATLTGSVLNLEAASASFGGVVTTAVQTFAGAKTFSSAPTFSSISAGRILVTGTGGLVDFGPTWVNSGIGVGASAGVDDIFRGSKVVFGIAGIYAINSDTGGSSTAAFVAGNGTNQGNITFTGTGYTTNEFRVANQLALTSGNAAGITLISANAAGKVILAAGTGSGTERLRVSSTGIGIENTNPTAKLHIAAHSATAGTAPLKLITGTALTTPEDGAFEYHTSHLYFTIGSTRYQLDQQSAAGGLTSVGLTVGLSGTDVNVSGSPLVANGSITLNIPNANVSSRGVVSTTAQFFGGDKSFANNVYFGAATSPTARVHIEPGTAAVNTAPIKLTSGTALSTPENGAVEFHSSHLWFTIAGVRYQLDQQSAGGGVGIGTANQILATDNSGSITEWKTISLGTTAQANNLGWVLTGGGAIVLHVPDATGTVRGVVTAAAQTFGGAKTFATSVAITGLTAGSVLFYTGGVIAQNNAQLFWSTASTALCIGTLTPLHKLTVDSSADSFTGMSVSNTNAGVNAKAGIHFATTGFSIQVGITGANTVTSGNKKAGQLEFSLGTGGGINVLTTNTTSNVTFCTNNDNSNTRLHVGHTGVGIGTPASVGGVLTPTAALHLPAGAAAAGSAPLKFITGTAMTTPEDGALEYHTSHLYFTIGSTRFQLDQQGGGGSPGGANTEVQVNNSSAFGGGKLFVSTPGNLIFGDTSTTGSRTLTVQSSSTNASMAFEAKGSGSFTWLLPDTTSKTVTLSSITSAGTMVRFTNSAAQGAIGLGTAIASINNTARIGGQTADYIEFSLVAGVSGLTRINCADGAGAGMPWTIKGMAAGGTNQKGGDVIIEVGDKIGTGLDGNIYIKSLTGFLIIATIPTSSAGLPSGAIWSNSNVLTRVP